MAEMRFGAGRDMRGVVLIITIGTGLGTALFSEGHLMPNTELGHVYLSNGVEAERYASEAVRVTKDLKWKDWGERLNLYLTTMESLLWPDLIVLGGGVIGDLTVNGATATFDLGADQNDTVGTVTLDGGGSISGTHSFTSPYGVLSALRPSSIYHVPFSNQPFMVLPLPQQTHTMSLIMQRCFSPLFSFQLSSCTGGGFLASCHDILRTKSTTSWLASLRAFAAASLPLKPL